MPAGGGDGGAASKCCERSRALDVPAASGHGQWRDLRGGPLRPKLRGDLVLGERGGHDPEEVGVAKLGEEVQEQWASGLAFVDSISP